MNIFSKRFSRAVFDRKRPNPNNCARQLTLSACKKNKPSVTPSALLLMSTSLIATLPSIAVAEALSEPKEQISVSASEPIASLDNLQTKPTNTQLTSDQLPKVEQIPTPLGQNAYFVRRTELPIVDIRLTFNAGSARDPEINPDALGLSRITAAMLSRGTERLSENQIATILEQYAIELSAASYKDMFVVSLRALSNSEALSTGIDLMIQLINEPSFNTEALERTLAQAQLGIAQAQKNPGSVASERFYAELYPNHPYGNPSSGTTDSLKLITPQLLREFQQRFLVASNANLAITGDLSLDQASQISDYLFTSMIQGQAAAPLKTPEPPKPKLVQVDFDSEQTHVLAGQLALPRSANNLSDLTLANQVLGGGMFSAVLMDELRRKRGLTYGAYSSVSAMQTTGPWLMSFSTQKNKSTEALKVADQVLKTYLQNGPNSEQIAEVKTTALNQFALGIASNSSINSWLAMMGFYDLGADYITEYASRVKSVSQQSAVEALKSTLSADQLIWVVVGPKSDLSKLALATPEK